MVRNLKILFHSQNWTLWENASLAGHELNKNFSRKLRGEFVPNHPGKRCVWLFNKTISGALLLTPLRTWSSWVKLWELCRFLSRTHWKLGSSWTIKVQPDKTEKCCKKLRCPSVNFKSSEFQLDRWVTQEADTGGTLWVWNQSNLCSKFRDSQVYVEITLSQQRKLGEGREAGVTHTDK